MLRIFSLFFTTLLCTQLSIGQQVDKAALDRLVQQYEAMGFSGQLLVAQKNTVVYTANYGQSNRETGAHVQPHTLFRIESVSKMMTATLIMQLVEAGRLALHTPINQYLPDSIYQLPQSGKVTIHHLLTHRAGYVEDKDAPGQKTLAIKSIFEPGSRQLYSNAGYLVLGEMVARMHGKPYEQVLQQQVLEPAGIQHFFPEVSQVADSNLALPYKFYSEKKFRLVKENMEGQASAAGGWYTTAGDLWKFIKAYRDGRYFSKNTWEVMRTAGGSIDPKPAAQEVYTYGLNWLTTALAGQHIVYGHSGGGLCYNAAIYFEPESDYTVITLNNVHQPSRQGVSAIFRLLQGEPVQPPAFDAAYTLMTLIDSAGIKSFTNDHQRILAGITGNAAPSAPLFIKLLDGYMDLSLYDMVLPVVTIAEMYVPDNKALWYYFAAAGAHGARRVADAANFLDKAKKALQEKPDAMIKMYVDQLEKKMGG